MEQNLEDQESAEYQATEEESISEGELLQPFDPTKIRVESKQLAIESLLLRMEHNEILLQPEFQRAEVWKDSARSRLIESILIRIPLPAFYVDATDDDKWQVIDGQQRLSTLRRFIIDKNLKLTHLEFLSELENKGYDELAPSFKRRIRETNVIVYKIEQGTPPEVKFNIFRRINTGGLPLSAQEIRHALNLGPATDLLREIADSAEFKAATVEGIPPDRMADRETVLRFFAFILTDPYSYNEPEFDSFLSSRMKDLNEASKAERDELRQRFFRALSRGQIIFGKHAFRKYKNPKKRQPINKAIMEAWLVAMDRLSVDEYYLLSEHITESLLSKWLELNSNRDFENAVSQGTGDPRKVHLRFKAIESIVKETLND